MKCRRSLGLARIALVLLLGLIARPAPALAATPWPHDPNAVVRSVLAQPEYRTAPRTNDAQPQPGLWELFWSWLKEQLKKLFAPIARAVSLTSRAGAIAGIVLSILAVVGLGFVLARLGLAFAVPRTRAPRVFGGRPLGELRSSTQWRDAAAGLAASGDYARAIAALFRAALAVLDERALVPFDATRTPGEYRQLVRGARQSAAPPFDALTSDFVRAAYSGMRAARSDYDDAERAFARFEPLLGAP